MKRNYKIILGVLIILILIYIGFSFFVANEMTKPMAPRLDVTPRVISENYEDIEFKSIDNLTLRGWLFKTDTNKLVIMVPGLTQNRINTAYYAMWVGKDLVEGGYNVLMYDPRANGLSEGDRVSYGKFEVGDILGAVEFAKDRGFKPERIAILGDSTGAITTLMAADQLKEVGALILDSAATNFKPLIINRLWTEKRVPTFFAPAIFFFTDTVFGTKIGEVKPIERLPLVSDRKFLYLHGELDDLFPIEESKKLLEASNPESKLVTFPKGNHVETFKSDPNLYRREIFNFLESEIGD